jgi:hypothetical protein
MQPITVDTDQDENTNGLTQEVNATKPTLSGNDYLDHTLQKEIALWFAQTNASEGKSPIN